METQRATYQSSGKIGISLIVLPIFGLLSAVAVAAAYGYGSVYNPSMKLAFILPMLGGGAIGGLLALGGIVGKCRSMVFLTLVSFIVSLICTYLIWTFFSYALLWRSDATDDLMLIDFLVPSNIWMMMQFIVEEGWYSTREGIPVTGTTFWWKWSFEALTIVGIGTILPPLLLKSKPFCEASGRWMTYEKGVLNLVPVDDESVFARMVFGDIDAVLQLQPAHSDRPIRLRLDLWKSAAEEGGGVYQIQLVTTQFDKKGNTQDNEKQITGRLVVNQREVERIEQYALVQPTEQPLAAQVEAMEDQSARDGFDRA